MWAWWAEAWDWLGGEDVGGKLFVAGGGSAACDVHEFSLSGCSVGVEGEMQGGNGMVA